MAGVGGDAASTSTGWAPPGTAPGLVPPSGAHPPGGTFSSDASVTVTGVHTYLGAHSHLVTLVLQSLRFGWFCLYFWGWGGGEGFESFMCDFKHLHARSHQTGMYRSIHHKE